MCEGGSDAGSDQCAEREPEGDGEKDVTDADHDGGSLDCAAAAAAIADTGGAVTVLLQHAAP
jgi:hypothetical protein